MNKIIKSIGIGIFLLVYSVASNSAALIVDNGVLMGATEVDVNGELYDVKFLDGTCIDLYNGCDQKSDFAFSNPTNDATMLTSAMRALLEQVFIDSPMGLFDTNTALTNGCIFSGTCEVFTPLSSGAIIGAINLNVEENSPYNPQNSSLDHITAGQLQIDYDTTNNQLYNPRADFRVYAVWSETTVVPIPAAIWLFISGLLGLFSISKIKK